MEKRVPWKVAKESYLEITKKGHQNSLTFENKTQQPETSKIVPKTETLSPEKLLNLMVNVHKLASENTKTQEEKIEVIQCPIDDIYCLEKNVSTINEIQYEPESIVVDLFDDANE